MPNSQKQDGFWFPLVLYVCQCVALSILLAVRWPDRSSVYFELIEGAVWRIYRDALNCSRAESAADG